MAVEVGPLAPGEEEAWNAYARRNPRSTVFHRAEWREVARRSAGFRDRYLAARRGGAIVGILPLLHHRTLLTNFLVTSIWVDGEDPEAERALLDEAVRITREVGARYLELRNYWKIPSPLLVGKPDYRVYRLPIPSRAEDLWKRLDDAVRQKVRRAAAAGLEVVEGREHLPGYYEIFAENMRDLGTPVFPRRYFEEVLDRLPDAARLLAVRRGGTVIGGGISLSHRDTVYWPFSSSSRRFFDLAPNVLLYWEALRRASAERFRTFDFGRSKEGSGTARFKESFGAAPRSLAYQYFLHRAKAVPDVDPDHPRYRLAIGAWKRMPLWAQKALGPRLVRFLA